MAVRGYSDINCPICSKKIGAKQESTNSGGATLRCTSCKKTVKVNYTDYGYEVESVK